MQVHIDPDLVPGILVCHPEQEEDSKIETGTSETVSAQLLVASPNNRSAKNVSFCNESSALTLDTFHPPHNDNLASPWDDIDDKSLSGYSANSGKIEDTDNIHHGFFLRLVRFYQKYNPEKLPRVEEFLSAYKGEEEHLFKILIDKYGPEPPGPSEEVNSESGIIFHFVGKRFFVPKEVSPEEGCTDCITPYWPGSKQVMDTDLLALLHTQKTENLELQKCFVGLIVAHPTTAWNGLTYLTKAPLPTEATPQQFLQHQWSGSLANNKTLVHQRVMFSRTVYQCNPKCQQQGLHERWRLTVYRTENVEIALYRVVWDPQLSASPVPEKKPEDFPNKGGELKQPFFSFSNPERRRKVTTQESALSPRAPSQPQQPLSAAPFNPFETFGNLLSGFEKRTNERLDSIESRITRLEDGTFRRK